MVQWYHTSYHSLFSTSFQLLPHRPTLGNHISVDGSTHLCWHLSPGISPASSFATISVHISHQSSHQQHHWPHFITATDFHPISSWSTMNDCIASARSFWDMFWAVALSPKSNWLWMRRPERDTPARSSTSLSSSRKLCLSMYREK